MTGIKSNIILCITSILIFFVSSCSPYSHQVFKANTGLSFNKDVNLCPGAGVSNQKSCKPTSTGWSKGNKITGATLEANDTIFKRIVNDYLMQRVSEKQIAIVHNYDLWGSRLNIPKSEIIVVSDTLSIDKEMPNSDYIAEPYTQVPISELYEKTAITYAISTLESEAKLKNLKLDADFVLNVTNELKKKIKSSKNTDLTVYFIQAEYKGLLSSGEDDEGLNQIIALQPTIDQFNNNKKIIVGISGILFTNLKSTQTVVEESMLSTSIDAAISMAPNIDLAQIQDLKLSASTKWSNTVNENINTSLQVIGNGSFFYPLWYKSVSKK